MANSFIVLPGDITGKKIRTRVQTEDGNNVENVVVVLSGADGNIPHIHEDALATTSMRHCKVSDGKLFCASKVWVDVVDDALATYLIKCHVDYHIIIYFEFSAAAAATIEIFETPTISANGTAVVPRNMNRNFTDTLNTLVYHTPTISADGTLLSQIGVGSGKTGSGTGEMIHWHLKEGLGYYVKMTNVSGAVNTISAAIKFFETMNGS